MRICNNCQTEMADLMLSVAYNRWAVAVRKDENSKNLGHVKCAVCPKCGEISLYLQDLTKLNKYLERK